MSSLALRSTIAGLTLTALFGCFRNQGQTPPASATTTTTDTTVTTTTAAMSGVRVTVGDSIRQTCALAGDPLTAPHFESRSANMIETGAESDVDRAAECIKNGTLKGAGIRVVSRANDSGDPNVDADLAMKRAEAAKEYLVKLGIPPENVAAVSEPAGAAGSVVEIQIASNPRFKRR